MSRVFTYEFFFLFFSFKINILFSCVLWFDPQPMSFLFPGSQRWSIQFGKHLLHELHSTMSAFCSRVEVSFDPVSSLLQLINFNCFRICFVIVVFMVSVHALFCY